jgi:predicted house-cleaning noncanonical NTP pyrophosphatase (MazG superfamily)
MVKRMADPLVIASWQADRPGLSAVEVGGKARGLWSLPQAWAPPFVVFRLPFFDLCRELGVPHALAGLSGDDAELLQHVVDGVRDGAKKVIVRSNAPDEARFENRGRYVSVDADAQPQALATAISKVVRQADGPMCVLVQALVERSVWGHLSNERRVSKRRTTWLVEEHAAGDLDPSHRVITPRPAPPAPLYASHRDELPDRLREVAAHLASKDHLTHCEWVWDGQRVWIVQADRITPSPGDADRYLGSRAAPPADESTLRLLTTLDPEEASRWSKLARRTVMQQLGMPVPPVHFLGGEVCRDIARHRSAFEEDFAALSSDGSIPLVLRCDLLREADDGDVGESALSLPTSKPSVDATAALTFIERVAEHFAASGIEHTRWAVLPAQLVPARASIMVQARPGAQTVRLDALWGFPDGIGCLSHDTYLYRIDRESFSETCRYKESCLLYNAGRGWYFAAVGMPHDWGHVLNEAEVRTAASWARRIADHLHREVQLMVLARTGGARGAEAMRPWHYTDHTVPPWAPPVRWAPQRGAVKMRTPSDLERLRNTDAKVSGIHFAPLVEDRRDTGFIRKVAALAVELGVPVYFSGSVLGHTYYILRSAGAHVVLVGIDSPEVEPDQYDKLVRDRIPEVVRRSGATARVVRANPEQGVVLLKHKLIEEALEIWNAQGDDVRDELADLLEVLDELCRRLGLTRNEVLAAQDAKRSSRGGFEQLLYLEATAPEANRLEESRLFPTSPEPIVSTARRAVGPVSIERADSQAVVLRVPAAPPLRGGVPLREYSIDLAQARLRFRHDGLNLEITVERVDQPNVQGQLSLPIEIP